MLFNLRTPFLCTIFGVGAELRAPIIRGCTVFALLQLGLGLAYFYSPDPKKYSTSEKQNPKWLKWAQSFQFLWIVFGFLGFEPNGNVGQDDPQLPRANENIV